MVYMNYDFLEENVMSNISFNVTNSSITDRILEEITKQAIKKAAELVVDQVFETAPYVISYVGETMSSNYAYYFESKEEDLKEDPYGVTADYANSYELA